MMIKDSIRITVLFEDPFWVGILEKTTREGYSVAKTIFGSEPTNNDVYYYLLKRFDELFFSKLQSDDQKIIREINPKRRNIE